MAINLKKYQRIKSKVEELQKEANRAEGALAQTMVGLKEEFDCETIGEAQKLKKKLDKEAEESEDKFNKALSNFEEEWGETLEEN